MHREGADVAMRVGRFFDPLVRMKLTAWRNKDRTHLRDMIGVDLLDATWPVRLPPPLGARFSKYSMTLTGDGSVSPFAPSRRSPDEDLGRPAFGWLHSAGFEPTVDLSEPSALCVGVMGGELVRLPRLAPKTASKATSPSGVPHPPGRYAAPR